MRKERVIGSYLLRFTQVKQEKHFYLQNLRSGEVIEFETWVSAWAFLEQTLETDALANAPLFTASYIVTKKVPMHKFGLIN